MKNSLKKSIKYIKSIFFIGVLILVVFELARLRKEISLFKLKEIMGSVGIFKMLLMGIFGFLAISPMLNYDFLFSKMMGDDRDKKYILERSITINTFNNLIGFGGLINIGLRAQYFDREDDKGNLIKMILKSFLFYFTGCSFLALIGLLYAFISKDSIILSYWPILLGGVVYYLFAFLVSKYKNNDEINFSNFYAIKFSITSILEWSAAFLTFLVIGYLLGFKINIFRLISIFIIANLTGIVSMIPGGLGSFDLLALTMLTSYGIAQERVLSWLLLYRLFYYVIPFFVGLVLFIKNSDNIFTKTKDEVGKRLLKSLSLDLLVGLLILFGIFLIFSVTIPDELGRISWLKKFGHLQANIIYQFPSILFGILYIFLAKANNKKVKKAFYPTLLILSLTLIYTIITGFSAYTITYIIFCMILAFISKNQLYKKQLVYSYEDISKITLLITAISVISISELTKNYNIIRRKLIKDFLILPFEIPFMKIILFILIVYGCIFLLNQYLRDKKIRIGEKVDFLKIDYLLENFPSNTTAGLSYLGDKDMFYIYDEGNIKAALEIFTYKDKVIVMGEPFGDPNYYEKLIEDFINQSDLYDYNPVFYEISEKYLMHLHDHGFQFMKFGETASVDLKDFSLTGKNKKSMRNVINKFEKSDITFEVENAPHSEDVIDKLEMISDKWLDGRKEMGFSLGFFDRSYLQKSKIALIKDKDNEIIAFSNIIPNENSDEVTIDLMRFDHDKSINGTMDFLFINLFLYFKSMDEKSFDLGMAPLYNVGVNENSFLQEKLAFLVYKFGDRFYSFEGLRNYKQKFATKWIPIYTSYSKDTWIFYLILILFKVERIASKKINTNN